MTDKLQSKYKKYKILKKIIRKDRWYVQIESPDGKTLTLPFANYNWLITNPSFPGIPKGYVIHHLDNDPLNDDPSNLALMEKNQHRSYHFKYANNDVPIDFKLDYEEEATFYYAIPRHLRIRHIIRHGKRTGKWRVEYRMKTRNKTEQFMIHNYKGKSLETLEQAEKVVKEMFPEYEYSVVENKEKPLPQPCTLKNGLLPAIESPERQVH